MKEYQPRRSNECPRGIHPPFNPAEPYNAENCDCPWLAVRSSTPDEHVTTWSRAELDTLLKNADEGYFDPAEYRLRQGSMFVAPNVQRLLDVAKSAPAMAAMMLLAGLMQQGDSAPQISALAWDGHSLAVREGSGGWVQLTFSADGGASVERSHDYPQAAQILWDREAAVVALDAPVYDALFTDEELPRG